MNGTITFERHQVEGRDYVLATLESGRPRPAWLVLTHRFTAFSVWHSIGLLIDRSRS